MYAKEAEHLYHLYVCISKEKKEAYLPKEYFVILCLGAEPHNFHGQRKLLNKRLHHTGDCTTEKKCRY